MPGEKSKKQSTNAIEKGIHRISVKIFLQFVSFCSKKDELKIRKVKKGKIRKYRTCLKEELKSFVKPSRRNCEGETLIYKCMMQTP